MGGEGERFDLVLRGGTVVTADGREEADVGVLGERVAGIGDGLRGRREIDARGRFVLPGGVDAHVHLTPSEAPGNGPVWCDDFFSGTRAAAAGGVTTVGNMTFPRPGETLLGAIAREAAEAARDAVVDVVLHPVLTDPASQPLAEIPHLAAAGHTSLKFFTSFGGFAIDPAPYLEAMRLAGTAGMLTLVHCEDEAILRHALGRLVAAGRTAVAEYPRPRRRRRRGSSPLRKRRGHRRTWSICRPRRRSRRSGGVGGGAFRSSSRRVPSTST